MSEHQDDGLCTVSQVAEALGVTAYAVKNWITVGKAGRKLVVHKRVKRGWGVKPLNLVSLAEAKEIMDAPRARKSESAQPKSNLFVGTKLLEQVKELQELMSKRLGMTVTQQLAIDLAVRRALASEREKP